MPGVRRRFMAGIAAPGTVMSAATLRDSTAPFCGGGPVRYPRQDVMNALFDFFHGKSSWTLLLQRGLLWSLDRASLFFARLQPRSRISL